MSGETIASFHQATFDLLEVEPQTSASARAELESTERRLGLRLPDSVREWYSCKYALHILAEHSNQDPPIPVHEFALSESSVGPLISIRWENQGVCTWAILLDGSEDPPVFVDVDSNGTNWQRLAPTFSTYVYTCVWDYRLVFQRPGLVQAQNDPLSSETLEVLSRSFEQRPSTFGWPGSVQYRFAGPQKQGIIIWSQEGQSADWFVAAEEAVSLESVLRLVWNLDEVGKSFYDCSNLGKEVLTTIRARSEEGP